MSAELGDPLFADAPAVPGVLRIYFGPPTRRVTLPLRIAVERNDVPIPATRVRHLNSVIDDPQLRR